MIGRGQGQAVADDPVQRVLGQSFVKFAQSIPADLEMLHSQRSAQHCLNLDGAAPSRFRAARFEAHPEYYSMNVARLPAGSPAPPPSPTAKVKISSHADRRSQQTPDTFLGTKLGTNAPIHPRPIIASTN